MKNFKQQLPYFLSYLISIAFSIKSLREPDLWWQIRTGDWILENGKVPTTDPFSFTYYGQPWINIKWGFEVLASLISNFFGPESIFLLQIAVSVLIIYFLKKIASLYLSIKPIDFLLAILILFIGIEYRIIGRPEMVSHLFLVISLYLLLNYEKNKSKSIWLLIPLQIVWTNMHEAYGMGIVLIMIFVVGNWFDCFNQKTAKPKELSLILLCSILSIIINPRTYSLLIRPFNIFNQVQENKYTTELANAFSKMYWQKESFILLILVLGIFTFGGLKKMKFPFLSTSYFLVCLAFLVLALMAFRNIIFLFLVLFPIVLAITQEQVPDKLKDARLVLPIAVIFYGLIVSGKYYQWTNSRDRYGLEVLSINNPVGAANHLISNSINTKKGFADYLTSSYLLWKLQPEFKSYIDLRDLDVFPTSYFNSYLEIMNDPKKFHEMDKKENFQYVVLFRNSFPALHRYLYTDTIFACTYSDAVAAVYEKTDNFSSGDIFSGNIPVENSVFANIINVVFNPFYHSFDYDAIDYNLPAAQYYYMVGRIQLADVRIKNYLTQHPNDKEAIQLNDQINAIKSNFK